MIVVGPRLFSGAKERARDTDSPTQRLARSASSSSTTTFRRRRIRSSSASSKSSRARRTGTRDPGLRRRRGLPSGPVQVCPGRRRRDVRVLRRERRRGDGVRLPREVRRRLAARARALKRATLPPNSQRVTSLATAILAHRGLLSGPDRAAENTRAALRSAVQRGFCLEFDVNAHGEQLTLAHDPTPCERRPRRPCLPRRPGPRPARAQRQEPRRARGDARRDRRYRHA